jgi:hypothetical protein
MGRPKKYFTILREGEVLGRFSRDEITASLKTHRFLKGDRFKDPRDASWKPLAQLTPKVTSRGHKKIGLSKRTAKPVRRQNTGSGRTFGMLNQNSRERSEFRFRCFPSTA